METYFHRDLILTTKTRTSKAKAKVLCHDRSENAACSCFAFTFDSSRDFSSGERLFWTHFSCRCRCLSAPHVLVIVYVRPLCRFPPRNRFDFSFSPFIIYFFSFVCYGSVSDIECLFSGHFARTSKAVITLIGFPKWNLWKLYLYFFYITWVAIVII